MAKERKVLLDERETVFRIDARDRDVVHGYSNDPVLQRKLRKAGILAYGTGMDGGQLYEFPANQLRITKPARKLSEEEKAAAAARLWTANQERGQK